MVHMGGFSLLMFLFIGIAWGAMPINPSKLRGRHSESLVAVAGPMMNLLLAIVALVLLVLWVPLTQGELISSVTISEPLATNMKTFLHLGAMLNIVLLLFNLLPVPPLDGGRIAMSFIPAYGRMLMSENGRWIVLGVFLLFFMFAGSILFALAGFSVNAVSHGVWAILFPNLSV
jgi:Zn-dependent protease